jgi:hypothetical protein
MSSSPPNPTEDESTLHLSRTSEGREPTDNPSRSVDRAEARLDRTVMAPSVLASLVAVSGRPPRLAAAFANAIGVTSGPDEPTALNGSETPA